MFNLTGQTAFITGASRGIGFAAAKALGLQGAKVIINARNPETLQQARQALEQEGIETVAAAFDISQPREAVAQLEALLDNHKIDIFMGNAATQHRENLLDYPLEKFEEIIQVNLTSQWAMGAILPVIWRAMVMDALFLPVQSLPLPAAKMSPPTPLPRQACMRWSSNGR